MNSSFTSVPAQSFDSLGMTKTGLQRPREHSRSSFKQQEGTWTQRPKMGDGHSENSKANSLAIHCQPTAFPQEQVSTCPYRLIQWPVSSKIQRPGQDPILWVKRCPQKRKQRHHTIGVSNSKVLIPIPEGWRNQGLGALGSSPYHGSHAWTLALAAHS